MHGQGPALSAEDRAIVARACVGNVDEVIVELEARLRRAQLTGDVAALDALIAVALAAYLTVVAAGQRLEGPVRYTRVWAREPDGQWRIVAGHVSAVPEAVLHHP
jgi:ketosteroid isomerase-like protein